LRKRILLTLLAISLLSIEVVSGINLSRGNPKPELAFQSNSLDGTGVRVLVPLYLRLQAMEEGNITLWMSLPQNFTDRVATINSRILAMFASSNSQGFSFSRDKVGNLWVRANYSLNAGDYINTLTWVSSQTLSENLTSLGFVPFPQTYPDEVKPFLDPGGKIPAENQTMQSLAASFNQTLNMTQTIRDVLDFVNKQGYDREKTRLLLSGNLTTTDILGFFKDALQVHETNSSICLERSWYAAAILRAASVPTRTVTDVRLKTWIQVWLPNIGWVDGETLCAEPPPHIGMLPKSIFASVPWMIENSSDAAFPFVWFPAATLRIANLTFAGTESFKIDEYRTVFSEPIDVELFEKDPAKFRFPVALRPETIYAAVTREKSNLNFHLFGKDENTSRPIRLEESNSVILGDVAVSFTPISNDNFLILEDFSVERIWKFDVRILIPVAAVPVVLVVWLYWKRRRHGR